MEYRKLPVVVHSDRFHADEVMAVAILNDLNLIERTGEELVPTIVRTRDRDVIEEHYGKAYILDVGGVDDPANLRFDHHQRGFERYYNETAERIGVKMSSCGLLYDFLGTDVIKLYIDKRINYLDLDGPAFEKAAAWCRENGVLNEEKLGEWCNQFYNAHILEIDANDNGVSHLKDDVDSDEVLRYKTNWNLPAIVGRMNTSDTSNAEHQLSAFRSAVNLCSRLFHEAMFNFLMSRMAYEQSYRIMQDILDESTESPHGRYEVCNGDGDGGILILYENFDYESAARDLLYKRSDGKWLFTILPKDTGSNSAETAVWRIHTVGVAGKRFVQRANIIPADRAREIIGDALIFVHANQFVGDTYGFDAAYAVVKSSVDEYHRSKAADEWCETLENISEAIRLIAIAALAALTAKSLMKKMLE